MTIDRLDPSCVGVANGDEAEVRRYIEHDFNIRSGLCPNGCGLMTEDASGQQCPACGFSCNVYSEKGNKQ